MPEYFEYELAKAANKLVSEILKLEAGETIVITADTESDSRVVDATAAAAFAVGAKPLVVWNTSPLGVGKAADPMLPGEALTAVLSKADAWVEFNNQWIFYSTVYETVMSINEKIRHCCYVGMNVDMMVRGIGRIDLLALGEYQNKFVDLLNAAKHITLTTPAGENVEIAIDHKAPIGNDDGYADTPGSHMLGGQLGPGYSESVNGTIIFDGSIVPPIGLVTEPVKLQVKEGIVKKIEGGKDAQVFEAWLKDFNDPNMFRVAHLCFGCNPGARLTGNIVADERVWGSTEWGLGYVGSMLTHDGKPIPAASHTDGICLNTSVWLDGEQIWDRGRVIHSELALLAEKLGKT